MKNHGMIAGAIIAASVWGAAILARPLVEKVAGGRGFSLIVTVTCLVLAAVLAGWLYSRPLRSQGRLRAAFAAWAVSMLLIGVQSTEASFGWPVPFGPWLLMVGVVLLLIGTTLMLLSSEFREAVQGRSRNQRGPSQQAGR